MQDPMALLTYRSFHNDYTQPLNVPFIYDPFSITFIERKNNNVLLYTTHRSGRKYYCVAVLKPERWMSMDKDDLILPTDERIGYTYWEEGPFAYYAGETLEDGKKRLNNMNTEDVAIVEQEMEAITKVASVPLVIQKK